jgi:hypothetical protein
MKSMKSMGSGSIDFYKVCIKKYRNWLCGDNAALNMDINMRTIIVPTGLIRFCLHLSKVIRCSGIKRQSAFWLKSEFYCF